MKDDVNGLFFKGRRGGPQSQSTGKKESKVIIDPGRKY